MINRMFFFVMFFMTPLTTASAQEIAKVPPPFGLTWGMSQADAKRMGILLECHQDKLFTLCKTASLPKNLSNAESYILTFSADNKLVEARYASNNFINDAFGTKGKAEYERVKKILSKKYGLPPINLEFVGQHLYKEKDEFYQCLSDVNCGIWSSQWKFPYKSSIVLTDGRYVYRHDKSGIHLTLSGLERGIGHISITYTSSNFEAAFGAAKDKHKEQDESAL